MFGARSAEYWENYNVNAAIELLIELGLYRQDNIDKIKSQPKWALSVKSALQEVKGVASFSQADFDAMISQPQFAYNMGLAISSLSRESILTRENLTIISENSEFSDRIALIFCRLNKASILTVKNRELTAQHAKHAFGVAAMLAELEKYGSINEDIFNAVMQNPQRAGNMADALTALSRLQIASQHNILKAIHQSECLSDIIPLLHQLNAAGMVHSPLDAQKYFDTLLNYAQFSTEIRRQVSNLNPITEIGFNQIIDEKQKSIEMSFLLGTHPKVGVESAIFKFFGTHPGSMRGSMIPFDELSEPRILKEIFQFSKP